VEDNKPVEEGVVVLDGGGDLGPAAEEMELESRRVGNS